MHMDRIPPNCEYYVLQWNLDILIAPPKNNTDVDECLLYLSRDGWTAMVDRPGTGNLATPPARTQAECESVEKL